MAPPSEPSLAMLNLSVLSFLLGLTTITWCLTRSLQEHQIWPPKTWFNMPWSRLCLILVLLTSWIYLLLTSVLLFGAPPRHTEMRCTLGTMACILLYGTTKGFIYLCLIERVHAVWSDGRRRWNSHVYRFCLVLMIPFGGIAGYMLDQGIHYLRGEYCILGIRHTASAIFLSYDIALNIFLTFLFVAPLVRSTTRSAWLKAMALRAIVATTIGLVTTIINGFVLFAMGGEEIIWVCLGACATDVVINAVVMYWAMQSPPRPKASVHFSPLSISNGTQAPPNQDAEHPEACGGQNKPVVHSFAMHDYGRSQDDTLSHATSSGFIPVIDIPQPAMRNTRHVDLYNNHPSGSRLSLSLSAKKAPTGENCEDVDRSLQGQGLVQNRVNDSEIYGLKNGQSESRGK